MSNKTILFADDSATMRTIVEKTFVAEPFDVTVVPSGEAAITKAREISPDVIIADAGMAGVSGYDVCKAVREDASLGTTPFLIMSGVSNPYDNSRGSEVGVDEFVKKPFDTTQLIELVTTLVSRAKPEPVADPVPAAIPVAKTATTAEPSRPEVKLPRVIADGAPAKAKPVSVPSSKKTMEFGAASAREESSAEKARVQQPEPSVPIDLRAPAEKDTFQVSTLAEMAQIDEEGTPIATDAPQEAIDLSTTPQPIEPVASQTSPAAQKADARLPIAEAVQQRAKVASEEIEKAVDGLTPDQVEAIRVLTNEVIERVVWEIVPDLAETIIKEEIAKLLEE